MSEDPSHRVPPPPPPPPPTEHGSARPLEARKEHVVAKPVKSHHGAVAEPKVQIAPKARDKRRHEPTVRIQRDAQGRPQIVPMGDSGYPGASSYPPPAADPSVGLSAEPPPRLVELHGIHPSVHPPANGPASAAGSQRGMTLALGILVGVLVAGAAMWVGLAVSGSRANSTTPASTTTATGLPTASPGSRAPLESTNQGQAGTTGAATTTSLTAAAPTAPRAGHPGGVGMTRNSSGTTAPTPSATNAPAEGTPASEVANPFAVPGEAPRVKMY